MEIQFATIKVPKSAIQDLNIISAMTGEKQYEVVIRLAQQEKKEVLEKKKETESTNS